MNLEQRVGQQLVVGVPGTALTDELAQHLRIIRPGGFIPFASNFQSPEQFRALIASLHEVCDRQLVVMVDHEGGRVVRFGSGMTRFPDALTVGQTRRPAEVLQQGLIEGRELKALGVDVNLAPCVDVLVEGADPVIGTRSYGSDPRQVTAMGVARIQGLQQARVAACAKHFPGIGAVPRDPHVDLPTVDVDWEEIRRVHLVPFVDAIEAGVATIMSSHVCYPALGLAPDLPATFSSRLIRALLRQELGFNGVILSDDLEMGALRNLCTIGEAAVRAVEAGHDLVLICSELSAQRQVLHALGEAYRSGRLSLDELDHTLTRLQHLRQRVGQAP